MKLIQWLALLSFYVSYLFFGATVFYWSEHRLESQRRSDEFNKQLLVNDLLLRSLKPMDKELLENVIDQLSNYCEKPLSVDRSINTFEDSYTWDFYHSFFFSFIVCSTIGYGNISPNNNAGRVFMIFYAMIGLPVNGILFAYMGEYFGRMFVNLYKRYQIFKKSDRIATKPWKLSLVAQIMLYLLPGITLFIMIPSCFFTYFEDWDYTVSVYYSFVTLTTIGFGDYVPTFQAHQEKIFGVYFMFYQIFIILWFITGLGYLVMVMGFVAKGLKSKKISELELQLALNLRVTNEKLWSNIYKDLIFIRKVLHESNVHKIKPIFQDAPYLEHEQKCRSESSPDLVSTMNMHKEWKSRCYSVVPESGFTLNQLTRCKSDSNIARTSFSNIAEVEDHPVSKIVDSLYTTIQSLDNPEFRRYSNVYFNDLFSNERLKSISK